WATVRAAALLRSGRRGRTVGRIALVRLGRDGNRRCVRYRPEQKDLLTEQLGAKPRRGERSAQRADEVQQRRDGGLHLLARCPSRVPHEREQLASGIDLI